APALRRGDAGLEVTVRVQVDEPGGHDQAVAVNDLRLPGDTEGADAGDPVALDGQVALPGRIPTAVVKRGVADEEVGLDRLLLAVFAAQLDFKPLRTPPSAPEDKGKRKKEQMERQSTP